MGYWPPPPPKSLTHTSPKMFDPLSSLQTFYSLPLSDRKWRLLHFSRMATGKTTEYSKHLQHIDIEKDLFSELKRHIFQISLKYVKLVIPKTLVYWYTLYWYYAILIFTSKCNLPSHQNKNFWSPQANTFLKFLTSLPTSRGRGKGCMSALM